MSGPTPAGPTVDPVTTTTIPSDLPSDLPLGPYQVSVDQVLELIPHLELTEQGPVGIPQVARWILMCSQAVSGRLMAVNGLGEKYGAAAAAQANTVVANGAASYLSAATHGTDAGFNESSYSQVLWTRYTEGLDAVAAQVDRWALPGGGEETPPGGVPDPAGGLGGSFPPAMIRDGARW